MNFGSGKVKSYQKVRAQIESVVCQKKGADRKINVTRKFVGAGSNARKRGDEIRQLHRRTVAAISQQWH